MDSNDEDLRATAEAIAADAERLRAIELEKATLAADDPRVLELSAEADAIARHLRPKTAAQVELVKEAASES